MHVDLYERIWLWGAGAIIVLFLATIGFADSRVGGHE